MFTKILQFFKKNNDQNHIDNLKMIQDQQSLIKGLHFCVQQQQFLLEDLQALVAGLLLHCGSDEVIINKDFFESAINGQVKTTYEINGEGNVKVYLTTNEQTEI